MTSLKRLRLALIAACVAIIACIGLAGCGEPVAATYKGGKITEEDVTTTIQNMRVYYELEDDAAWAEFVKTRQYDTGTAGTMQTAVEKAAAGAAEAANGAPGDEIEGTVEEMREYVIEQLIRGELIEREIKNRHLEVDEADVEAYFEQQRSMVESRLMEGVFESYLRSQGATVEEYKESIREQLRQVLLQNDVSTVTLDDGQEISGKAAWNYWFDNLYEESNVKINPAPEPLEYAIVE